MMIEENKLREEIISTCFKMNQMGINQGTSGNISVRWKEGMLITPSGIPYENTQPEDIIYIDFNNNKVTGSHNPSTEWLVHRDILAHRPDANAVIHTHSVYATAMAIQRLDIPAHHYMVAAAGGNNIVCAEYATFGTQELSKNTLCALQNRSACLLANHGAIAIGPHLSRALWLANEVEVLAKQFHAASQYGAPVLLTDEEMDNIIHAFRSYGQKKVDDEDPFRE